MEVKERKNMVKMNRRYTNAYKNLVFKSNGKGLLAGS
jgi:hypothetical protein